MIGTELQLARLLSHGCWPRATTSSQSLVLRKSRLVKITRLLYKYAELLPQYVKENLKALDLHLTAEDLQAVRDAATKADATQGDRYPPGFMENLLADTPPL